MATARWIETNRTKWLGTRPAYDGERVRGYYEKSDGGATVYTVASNKVLLLTNYVLIVSNTGANNLYGYAYIRNSADDFIHLLGFFKPLADHVEEIANNFNPPYEMIEGDYIELSAESANVNTYISIYGVLLDE
jgi:hypothetical protein|tara:strand:- start:1667 stop:2068 length:402 start_codon:yes stop_codon:yes gene_type:complete